ncbi:MAG: hypothetical protein COA78_01425 [Blastopirellula sp.]|nr:MAG: hypothetical protein COA78_01425 [Blastopirellula sp.]
MKNGFFSILSSAFLLVATVNMALAQQPLPAGGNPGGLVPGAGQPQAGFMPYPFAGPIGDAELKHIDEVLTYWEYRSNKVVQYESVFKRWDYNSAFGPKSGDYYTYGEGQLKYAKPDKGLFKIENLRYYTAPVQPGAEATYVARAGDVLEHWVSNGKSIFQFDSRKKQLIENVLPPNQQGEAIASGPLPFLFGANKAKIKQQFWLRAVTPSTVKNEYWLQAWPKLQQDAAEFKYIEIIIDQKQFLPIAIQKFDRNYNPQAIPPNIDRTVYQFDDINVREKGDLALVAQQVLQVFQRAFSDPAVPFGWQKVINQPLQANNQNRPGGVVPR